MKHDTKKDALSMKASFLAYMLTSKQVGKAIRLALLS